MTNTINYKGITYNVVGGSEFAPLVKRENGTATYRAFVSGKGKVMKVIRQEGERTYYTA